LEESWILDYSLPDGFEAWIIYEVGKTHLGSLLIIIIFLSVVIPLTSSILDVVASTSHRSLHLSYFSGRILQNFKSSIWISLSKLQRLNTLVSILT